MKLDTVQLHNFRNIAQASIRPSESISFFYGHNGSGKSSVIESLYFLGFGRSFRTHKHTSVIQHDNDAFSVHARCREENGEVFSVGIRRGVNETFTCSINGEHSKRLADLVSRVPVQLFTPQSTDLIIGSPSERRSFLDWGLFHVEHSFSKLVFQYRKLLRHRNALLKQGANLTSSSNQYWEDQLSTIGEQVNNLRTAFVDMLAIEFEEIIDNFLPGYDVTISYYKGWEKDKTLSDSLVKKREYDGKIGHTSVGPHKADLRLKVNGLNAQEILSRGQLRMAVAALQIAQNALFTKRTNRQCIFLLDDIGAELDREKREIFVDQLVALNTQIFVTAIESDQLPFLEKYNDKKVFHVEHGHVKEE